MFGEPSLCCQYSASFSFGGDQDNRLSYGTAECAFGLITTLGVFIPQFDYARLTPLSVVQVLAGLSVIVRGMDNIGFGLKGTSFERPWTRVLGE